MRRKLVFAILLVSSPAWAQAKTALKGPAVRVDDCAPIGHTAKGELVYSMKCEISPPPPTPEVQADPAPTTPEPEDSGGLLGKFPFGTLGATPAGTKPASAGPAGH